MPFSCGRIQGMVTLIKRWLFHSEYDELRKINKNSYMKWKDAYITPSITSSSGAKLRFLPSDIS